MNQDPELPVNIEVVNNNSRVSSVAKNIARLFRRKRTKSPETQFEGMMLSGGMSEALTSVEADEIKTIRDDVAGGFSRAVVQLEILAVDRPVTPEANEALNGARISKRAKIVAEGVLSATAARLLSEPPAAEGEPSVIRVLTDDYGIGTNSKNGFLAVADAAHSLRIKYLPQSDGKLPPTPASEYALGELFAELTVKIPAEDDRSVDAETIGNLSVIAAVMQGAVDRETNLDNLLPMQATGIGDKFIFDLPPDIPSSFGN